MGIKFSGDGRLALLNALFVSSPGRTMIVGLFDNDVTPGAGVVWSDLIEATFSGYVRLGLTFAAVATDDGTSATLTGAPRLFTADGGLSGTPNIYGYFIYDEANSILIGAERFGDAPRALTVPGDTIPVVPRINLADQ